MSRFCTGLQLLVLLLALASPTLGRIVRSTRTQCGCTCCVNGACADSSKCGSAARTIGAIVIILGICCCIACCVGIYFRQRRNKRLANNQIAAMQVQPPADGAVQQGIPVQYAPVQVQYSGDPMAGQYGYPQAASPQLAQGPPAVPYDPNQYQYNMPPNQGQMPPQNQAGFYGQSPTAPGYNIPQQQQQAQTGATGYFPQYQMPPGGNTLGGQGQGQGQAGQTWGGQAQPGGVPPYLPPGGLPPQQQQQMQWGAQPQG